MRNKYVVLAGACLLALTVAAQAAGFLTNGLPLAGSSANGGSTSTLPLTGSERIPADTQLASGLNPQSEAVTTAQIVGYGMSQSGSGGWRNALIGGDFATNLWQRGTTSSAVTTVAAYGADRWWALSGTNTEVKQIKQTGASDITTGYSASNRFQRTAAQTGVVASCIGQVLPTLNSIRFQGKIAEFSVHIKAGGNFSAANSRVTMTIATGTGSDESMANFTTGSWTGYAAAVAQATTISTSWSRVSAVATIPTTATQIGVKICFTPVGTASTNDWFEFTGAQLDVNQNAVAYDGSSTTAAYNIASFERRPASIEALLQYSFFWALAEPASGATISGMCQAVGANTNICNVNLPTQMRSTTPTITIGTAGTFKVNIAGTPTTISSPTASTCSDRACAVTAANTNTAGQAELLTGGGGSGSWTVSAEL